MAALKDSSCLRLLAAGVLAPGMVMAQPGAPYPVKPVRVIVAQPAGGNADIQARLFGAKLSESLGKQFIVDNRPGRHIAWTLAGKSPADGYTVLAVLPDFTFAPALYSNLPVDPLRDFAPISLMTQTPYLLV